MAYRTRLPEKRQNQYSKVHKVFVVKQKRSYDVSLTLSFYFQLGLGERGISWFELILQFQTAQI